ncbi:hypothetical protein [Burkholderia sp. Ac-20365]|uniref:hypothetical protein n=1 Tax=Burkholderia sp. Ac-20365 TaxID=2703897 RepID=UPI001F11ABAA|nr:hypothetical protein [Burkholderia sp. Ac-20365]
MRRIAAPVQIAYQRLMSTYAGSPVGIECRLGDRRQWCFIVEEMSSAEDKWRIQFFDEDGFVGHGCEKTLEKAVERIVQEGYRTIDPGALDRIASTPRWARGVKVATIRQKHQEGLIDFQQMCTEMKALAAV